MKALLPGSTTSYVVKDERDLPVEEQAEFVLGTLTVQQNLEIMDGEFPPMRSTVETLRRGLRGWRKMFGEGDEEVEFVTDKNGQPTDATIGHIPLAYYDELATAILEHNGLTRGEAGNSE